MIFLLQTKKKVENVEKVNNYKKGKNRCVVRIVLGRTAPWVKNTKRWKITMYENETTKKVIDVTMTFFLSFKKRNVKYMEM